MNSDKEIEKSVNPIAITIIVLTLALGIAGIHFGIIHWSISAIGGTILLIFAASIRVADQWEKAVVLRMGKFEGDEYENI